MILPAFVIIFLSQSFTGALKPPGLLYVPKGRPKSEGIYLTETPKDQLPQGKYEIVAVFDDEEEQEEDILHESEPSPFRSLPPVSPVNYDPYRHTFLVKGSHKVAGPRC